MTRGRAPWALALLAGAAALALPVAGGARQAPTPPQEAAPAHLSFDITFGEEPDGRRATDLSWSPRGDRLAYRWQDAQGEALWILELPRGEARPLLRLAGEHAAEAAPAGEPGLPRLDGARWSPTGEALLLESGGDLYLQPLAGDLRRLTATTAEETDPEIAPDGGRVAFVRDANLHLLDLATGEEHALTDDGEPEIVLNGVTDWVYWEEIWNRDSTGFWWSPDGTRIAYYRFDERGVGRYPLVDPLPRYPEVRWQRYPKAGEANPEVRVGVLDLAAGKTVWLATGPVEDWYLARVHWAPDGGRVAVQRLDREQTRLELLSCDPTTGACAVLLTEEWPTWVNLHDDFTYLPDGRFLWSSEQSGWRQLYLHGPDGTMLRQLTRASGAVVRQLGVVAEETIVYAASGPPPLGAAERHVYRVRLDGSAEPERLTSQPGWHEALVAPVTGYWVHTWSDADTPPRRTVRAAGGQVVAALPSAPPAYDPAALPHWELFTIPGPQGARLPARLLRPGGASAGSRVPVLMYHYGGPGSQVVFDRWEAGRWLWHKLMAQRGYAVLAVDNLASIFFGKRGEDRVHRRFGEVNLAAQLAAVDFLGRQSFTDAARIGLWGWSGGGSNTLYCLLNRPGVWRAAVAGAPVTDWHLYDTIWTERYLDHPEDNADGYRASSPLTYARRLADPLLVVHGTGDDNVHPQNTLVLIQDLVAAGIPFEDAIYPREKHAFEPEATRHFYERMTEFFDRWLSGAGAE